MRAGATAAAAVAALLAVAAVAVRLLLEPVDPDGTTSFLATNAVTALTWGTVGAVVLRVRRSTVGALLLAIGLAHGVVAFAREYGLVLLADGHRDAAAWLLWLGGWPFLLTLWFPLLLLLLPDDRPPGARWRPFVVTGWLTPLPVLLTAALDTGPLLLADLPSGAAAPDNPLGGVALGPLPALSLLLLAATAGAALASLVVRWRRGGEQRAQLAWVALAGAVLVLTLVVEVLFPVVAEVTAPVLAPFVVSTFSLCTGVGLVRHRLLDVDVVVSRALLYTGLTATLGGLYVTVAVLLGALLTGPLPALVATTLVAVSFAPLRDALQRGLQRLLLGARQEPLAVLRRVLQAVDDSPTAEDVLPQLAGTVAAALGLPYAAVLLPGEQPASPVPQDVVDVPLHHRGRDVGRLLVGAGGRLDRTQQQLLADLTRQAAAAAHAVLLAAELRASRDRLLAAREDERRRLRSDLHDGLGPQLAAVIVQLQAARHLAGRDPGRVDDLLARTGADLQSAVADVRRLLEDLRPQALEQLGLLGALPSLALPLRDAGLEVHLDLPPAVALTDQVEVAAYRIAAEALTNAARHAGASTVSVTVAERDDALLLVVRDDGVGLPAQPRRDGLGLSSMRERAAALGGTVKVVGGAAGTVVTAVLPRQRARA